MTRLRLVQVVVQPVVVLDDGETLTPVPSAPITLTDADLDAFPALLRAQLEQQ